MISAASPRIRLTSLGAPGALDCSAAPVWFSQPEMSRWADLGAARKVPFLGSRILMRRLLTDTLGGAAQDWALDGRGHPLSCPSTASHSHQSRWQTSISHHQQRAAVGFCADAGGLGIDLERRHRRCRWEQIAKRWFSQAEQALLAGCDSAAGERLFYRLWTLKEAWVKATGRGLAGHFQAIQRVVGPASSSWCLRADTARSDWQAWSGWVGADCLAVIWQGGAAVPPQIESVQFTGAKGCSDAWNCAVEDPLQTTILPGSLDAERSTAFGIGPSNAASGSLPWQK